MLNAGYAIFLFMLFFFGGGGGGGGAADISFNTFLNDLFECIGCFFESEYTGGYLLGDYK